MKWDVDSYNKNAAYVSRYGEEVLALLNPQKGEFILDLGCGDGDFAEKIALAGCKVTAIDASPDMIAAAKKRGVNAHILNGNEMDFKDDFHAVFSNAALHWMTSSDRIITNVFNALRVNGRFCAELGGSGNVQTITGQLYKELAKRGLDGDDYNPWYFPSKERYARQLEQAGFRIDFIDQFQRPTRLPTNIAGWLGIFAKPFLRDIPDPEPFIQQVMAGVADSLQGKDGFWHADYVRLRFNAVKS